MNIVEQFMDQEKLYRTEGRKGVENLCTLCRAIGYKDPQYFGTLSSKASLGDLVNFLEDNSGAIEQLIEFIALNSDRNAEWQENIASQLYETEEN